MKKVHPQDKMFRHYPDALTLSDFANILGISTKLASSLIHNGDVPAVKVGREYRIAKINAISYLLGKKSCVASVNSNPKPLTSRGSCGMLCADKSSGSVMEIRLKGVEQDG